MKHFYYSIMTIVVISLTACSTPTVATSVTENNKVNVETKEKEFKTEGFLDYNFNTVKRQGETQQSGQDSIGKWHNIMGNKKYDCKWNPNAMELLFSYFGASLGVPKC